MATDDQPKQGKRSYAGGASAGPVYFLGGVGAAIYFLHQATTFWAGVLAILKAIVWPALLVYQAMHSLHL